MSLLLATPSLLTRVGGGLWTPADDAGLTSRWDASDTSSITDTSGTVSQIDDLVGVHDLGVQGNPQTGSRTQNGLNVLDLDGNDAIRDGTFAGFPGLSTWAIHMALVFDSLPTANEFTSIFGLLAQSVPDTTTVINSNDTVNFNGRLFVGSNGNHSIPMTGGPFSGLMRMSVVFGPTTVEAYVNGALRATRTDASMTAFDGTSGRLAFGAADNGALPIDGAFCEAEVTTAVDNVSDYADYFLDKWAA